VAADFDYVCNEGNKAFETYTGFCIGKPDGVIRKKALNV
jgi:hypothetical protein